MLGAHCAADDSLPPATLLRRYAKTPTARQDASRWHAADDLTDVIRHFVVRDTMLEAYVAAIPAILSQSK